MPVMVRLPLLYSSASIVALIIVKIMNSIVIALSI